VAIVPLDPPVAGRTCTASGQNLQIGDSLSNTNAEGRLTDGEGGAAIECRVSGSELFEVSLRASTSTGTQLMAEAQISAAGTGEGAMFVADPAIGMFFSTPTATPCQFNTDSGNLQIAPGLVWAEFTCEMISDPSSPNTTSCAAQGVVAFDNCKR
jgi:hypothetical protein